MATHSANINNLRTATLGEQVRSSMIQLFEEDYNLVLKAVTIGTDITSASSSTTGYYDGNVYINSNTLDIWKLIGTVWTKQGNLKGISTFTETPSTVDGGLNTITVTLTDGSTQTFTVKNGSKGLNGESVTGVVDNGDGTFYFTLSDGTNTGNIATIRGAQGIQGIQGATGATGRGVTSITSSDNGKNHVLSANFTDGTSNIITTLKDGEDGGGGGDMYQSTYDKNKNGIVDLSEGLSDGTRTLTFNDIDSKANKSTTLAGYGITDAYTKTETDTELAKKVDEPATDGTNGQALVTDGNGGRRWATVASSNYIESVSNDFNVTGKKLELSSANTTKLSALDNTTTDKDKVLTAKGDGTTEWKTAQGGISPSDVYTSVSSMPKDTDGYIDIPSTDTKVISAHAITEIANKKTYRIVVDAEVTEQGGKGIGTWCDDIDNYTSADSTDWIGARTGETDISNLLKIADNDEDIEVCFYYEADNNEPIYMGGYQLDTTLGRLCIKFGNTITVDNKVAIDITKLTKMN